MPSPSKPVAPPSLEARIAALPCWRAKVTLRPLRGGLSNVAFVADDGAARYVVRCGHDIPIHHVFRDRERAAGIAAHAAGLSPELIHAEPGIMVIRHVEGKTLVEADLAANIARIVPLLETCHRDVARRVEGPANLFWVFHVDSRLPADAAGRRNPSGRGSRALGCARRRARDSRRYRCRSSSVTTICCPATSSTTAARLWLIDWEYGGFGTAMFDLANLAANGRFAPAEDRQLLETYFEAPVRDELQRSFDAMKVASALREATWAMVSQTHARVPGVDYGSHAADFAARTELALAQFEERHGRL